MRRECHGGGVSLCRRQLDYRCNPLRPALGAVKYAHDLHSLLEDDVDRNVWRARYDKFASASLAASSSQVRVLREPVGSSGNAPRHARGGGGVLAGDIGSEGLEVLP